MFLGLDDLNTSNHSLEDDMRFKILLLIMIMLCSGCSRKLIHEKEIMRPETLEMHSVTCQPVLTDGALELRFEQVYSVESETVRTYSRNTFPLFDVAIGLATLGAVDIGTVRESDGVRHKTVRKPLDEGTPLSGFVRVTDIDTGRTIYQKPIACNLSGSAARIPLFFDSGCFRVDFKGEVNTLKRSVPVQAQMDKMCL
jgi:hypothetical protein